MGIITKVNLDVHGMRLITALSHVNFEKQMYIIWVHFLKYNYEFYIINICKEKEIDVYNMDGSETWPVCQYNFRATKSLTICERLSETKDSQPRLCWLLRCIIIFFTHSFNQPMCTECLWCVWSPTSYWTHRKTGKHTSNYYSVWWGLSRNHIPSAMEPQRKNLNQPGEGQGRRDSLLCFWSLLGLLGFKQSGEGRLGGIGGVEDGISDERERQLKTACRQGDSEKHDDKGGMIGEWESRFKGKEW